MADLKVQILLNNEPVAVIPLDQDRVYLCLFDEGHIPQANVEWIYDWLLKHGIVSCFLGVPDPQRDLRMVAIDRPAVVPVEGTK